MEVRRVKLPQYCPEPENNTMKSPFAFLKERAVLRLITLATAAIAIFSASLLAIEYNDFPFAPGSWPVGLTVVLFFSVSVFITYLSFRITSVGETMEQRSKERQEVFRGGNISDD